MPRGAGGRFFAARPGISLVVAYRVAAALIDGRADDHLAWLDDDARGLSARSANLFPATAELQPVVHSSQGARRWPRSRIFPLGGSERMHQAGRSIAREDSESNRERGDQAAGE